MEVEESKEEEESNHHRISLQTNSEFKNKQKNEEKKEKHVIKKIITKREEQKKVQQLLLKKNKLEKKKRFQLEHKKKNHSNGRKNFIVNEKRVQSFSLSSSKKLLKHDIKTSSSMKMKKLSKNKNSKHNYDLNILSSNDGGTAAGVDMLASENNFMMQMEDQKDNEDDRITVETLSRAERKDSVSRLFFLFISRSRTD